MIHQGMWGGLLQKKIPPEDDELEKFLSKKMERLGKGIIIGFPFVYEDMARTFRIEYINLIGEENGVAIRIYYAIIRHGNDDFMIIRECCDGTVASVALVIRKVMTTSSICRNCLHMKDPSFMCETCLPFRLTQGGDICAICLEDSCYFRLSCGHRFHRLCLIRINPFDTFTRSVHSIIKESLRCPVCRTPIDSPDICRIFDIQPETLLN